MKRNIDEIKLQDSILYADYGKYTINQVCRTHYNH